MSKPKAVSISNKQPLVVTTAHRGVFFGYGTPTNEKIIRLEQCRMCVYWSASLHGVVGLATKGPNNECRVGPAAPAITLQDITAVIEVTRESEAAWKLEPWN